MRTDIYGQMIFDENDLCDLYLRDPNKVLQKVLIESEINLPASLGLTSVPNIIRYHERDIPIEDFDRDCQNIWLMPDSYKQLDIAKFVLDQCKNEAELQRAGQELLMFQERNMFSLLQYLKYLVDTMRANNVVWGVGRGSSVASFVLFLIGIHKINSLYYDLNIDEFLK